MNRENNAARTALGIKRIQERLQLLLSPGPYEVPGVGLAVYRNGHKLFSYCGGQALLEAEGARPFTSRTLLRIASVSKQFTVYTLMQLSEQGKLDWDADVSSYLGFALRHPAFPEIRITARMLAAHTSGLRDGKVYSTSPETSLREFFVPQGSFYEQGAHFSPRTEPPGVFFCYCNLNYGLLGTIIEKITGVRFDLYQKQHLLQQLEIKGGYLPRNLGAEEQKNLGAVYRKLDAQGNCCPQGQWRASMLAEQLSADVVRLQNPYAEEVNGNYSLKNYLPGTNATSMAPQGGLWLCLEDMEHTLRMLLNQGCYNGKRIISERSLAEMQAPQWNYLPAVRNGDTEDGVLLTYGLGQYQVRSNSSASFARGQKIDLVGHTGQAFGLLSGIFMRPGTQDGFCYLMNGEALSENADAAQGRFSGNFIWEELLLEPVCELLAEF